MSTPTELRARASELEQRVPPIHAGPRTDDERMWLEKAAALRAEANRLETADSFISHMAGQDPDRLEADRAAAWGADRPTEK